MFKQFVYVAFIIKVFKLFYLQVAKYVVYTTNLWILFCVVVTVVTRWSSILILFRVSISCSSCFVMHEIIMCLNPRLPIVEFVHSGVWIIGTSDGCNLPLFAKISQAFRMRLCIHPLV